MDPRALEKAGEQGDVRLLQMLLQHDPNLLHQVLAATSMTTDTPLHTAAIRGHLEFVKEILTLVPDLARQRNKRGSYPLHLAAANGHDQVVEELLTVVGSDLCHLQDKDGRMAIHVAAMKGRIEVLDKLVAADPNSLEELVTAKGETVLHLSVRAHQISVVKFLAERPSFDDVLLNHKDNHGSTALHLAAAGKNLEMVKFLLSRGGIEVNAKNQSEDTALNLLEQAPCKEEDDNELRNAILQAGGIGKNSPPGAPEENNDTLAITIPLRNGIGTKKSSSEKEKHEEREWFKDMSNAVIIVATLIATVTFQVAVNPPGGYVDKSDCSTDEDKGKKGPPVVCSNFEDDHLGTAIVGNNAEFKAFMLCDVVALSTSMMVILLLLTRFPQRYRFVMLILIKLMQIAIFATVLAFLIMVYIIIPPNNAFGNDMIVCALFIWNIIIVNSVLWWIVGNLLWKLGVGLWPRVAVCLVISGFVLWVMVKYIYEVLSISLTLNPWGW